MEYFKRKNNVLKEEMKKIVPYIMHFFCFVIEKIHLSSNKKLNSFLKDVYFYCLKRTRVGVYARDVKIELLNSRDYIV